MNLFVNDVVSENQKPKIVVIGAGLAGLTAAYRLQQKGLDVHVYEARHRVGGRVFTAVTSGSNVELGGQGISDGGEAENISLLIEEMGLELEENEVRLHHSYFNGEELIDVEQLLKEKKFDPVKLHAQLNALAARAVNLYEVLLGVIDEKDPLFKSIAVRIASYEGLPLERLSPHYVETLYQMLIGGVSTVYQKLEEECILHLVTIKGGNALLPEKMAHLLKNRIHLGEVLSSISKSPEEQFSLRFRDGKSTTADILVLAIPCSVYKDIVFEEGILAQEKLRAIQGVQYGSNAKILVPFSEIPKQWTGLACDRAVAFFAGNRKVLTLYYSGTAGLFSEETILKTYCQMRPMLEMGFREDCPPLKTPSYAKDVSFCAYEGPVGYSWLNDPYARGSYSCIAAGQESLLTAFHEELGERVKTLFAPVGHKLYFAGEHASILMEVGGTMEAACESGERAARMILNALSLNQNSHRFTV